jgi:hypothetical protein
MLWPRLGSDEAPREKTKPEEHKKHKPESEQHKKLSGEIMKDPKKLISYLSVCVMTNGGLEVVSMV